MKKTKKILIFISMLMMLFLTKNGFTTNVYASGNDEAIMKGFELSNNWIYLNSVEYDEEEFGGNRYKYYGSMWSWFGLYYSYDFENNIMYVLMLSEVEAQPSTKSYWDQRRWNNKQMETTFSVEDSRCVSYAPKSTDTTGNISNTVSLSIGATSGENYGATTSVEFSESYNTSEITVTSKKDGNNKISIYHNFLRCTSNTKLESICCSHVIKLGAAIFKITNFNATSSYKVLFKNSVSILRHGVFNNSTATCTQTMQYDLKEELK